MVESTLWHPVALSEAVAAQAPLAVQLLELPVVLWRDSGGTVHALADHPAVAAPVVTLRVEWLEG